MHCLQKYSWKEPVNRTPDNFSAFQWKLCSSNGSTGSSEKVFLFFRSVFLFFKATLDTSLRFSRLFFSKWNWFVQMVNAIPGRHLLALNFAYHLSKPWSEWYFRARRNECFRRLRRWGRFARRNVCDLATEIPYWQLYWWRKIFPESGQKRWLVDEVVTLF